MEAIAVAGSRDTQIETVEDESLAATCSTTILITADRAAAVEHLARRIHGASARRAAPFVLMAAAGLPSDAAILTQVCAKLIDIVRGGSLLLTDVEHMPPLVQSCLLETLGDLQTAREPACRMRLMAGTTTLLYDRVSEGTFSEALFYRLNTIHVIVRNGARYGVWVVGSPDSPKPSTGRPSHR